MQQCVSWRNEAEDFEGIQKQRITQESHAVGDTCTQRACGKSGAARPASQELQEGRREVQEEVKAERDRELRACYAARLAQNRLCAARPRMSDAAKQARAGKSGAARPASQELQEGRREVQEEVKAERDR